MLYLSKTSHKQAIQLDQEKLDIINFNGNVIVVSNLGTGKITTLAHEEVLKRVRESGLPLVLESKKEDY
ncbi:MAG TPA: hypothetical protein VJA47_03070 [archaeon]|nr:hypothetical protein [archaeon]